LKIPGRKLVGKAEEIGNVVGVPMTRGLGLSDLLKRTFKEAWKDHLDAFAGNLTYKGLFAVFPLSVFLLSLLGLFEAPELLDTRKLQRLRPEILSPPAPKRVYAQG
jgi:membrane protein